MGDGSFIMESSRQVPKEDKIKEMSKEQMMVMMKLKQARASDRNKKCQTGGSHRVRVSLCCCVWVVVVVVLRMNLVDGVYATVTKSRNG